MITIPRTKHSQSHKGPAVIKHTSGDWIEDADGVSCLYTSGENGHLDVVKALLEAGGRELVMLTKGDGASCHYVSAEKGHVDVVRACWQKRRRVLPHSPVPALPLKRQIDCATRICPEEEGFDRIQRYFRGTQGACGPSQGV